jgi:hypothetical protein
MQIRSAKDLEVATATGHFFAPSASFCSQV